MEQEGDRQLEDQTKEGVAAARVYKKDRAIEKWTEADKTGRRQKIS